KFRQATGVADPVPAASLLPEEDNQGRSRGNENSVRNEISREDGMEKQGTKAAKEILEACEGTVVSLAAQLEIRINPNYTSPTRILENTSSIRCSRTSQHSTYQSISHYLVV
ncbi:MAG: hypothetical protein IKK82_01570, partial [Kiritimatiellae bacterium]|nr:hypothetical protein [Kiritimatiellia bacterium]